MSRKRPIGERSISPAKSEPHKLDMHDESVESTPSDSSVGSASVTSSKIENMYLDTVDRACLDFDFEQLCSVSLSNINVYACLVCGKYYQGRGKQSHAYFHSINDDHHVFINLKTLKAYVLPDNYEVTDRSLNDIKDAIRPSYSQKLVEKLDTHSRPAYDLGGKIYFPGLVGLNRIKHNSYMNAVVQALAHVTPIRDTLLLLPHLDEQPVLLQRVAGLVRKMWHPRLFRAHVSPHEFVQEVSNRSKRRFRLDFEGDPFEFLVWLLNTMHIDLAGTRKMGSSPIYRTFQGELLATFQKLEHTKERTCEDEPLQLDVSKKLATKRMPFLALSLELPPKPLFTTTSTMGGDVNDGDDGRADIPQVALVTLLQRYDGSTVFESNGQAIKYQLLHLPRYIICHIKRFSRSKLVAEKNPTVVNFSLRNVPFSDILPQNASDLHAGHITYDLIANICHVGQQPLAPTNVDGEQLNAYKPQVAARSYTSGTSGDSSTKIATSECPYIVYIRHFPSEKWYMLRDLQVEPIMPQMLFLSDSYIQIWRQN
ncbi:cysteine proteinase [Coemansia reversa NRRL 1564]|uniref:Cysteine proteinase n=1 Tax=Coemansia reversa (strain ATCC 12441 / NRRL 1564) TaxID=763665 RepID=A0A2G5B4K0_COERN|nr:cysteine proteinase [Coemansia reversa NRRL 1564]|eukprot:PIA13973.1 cysteine proteinase [Coemansia reversa NRRL 1564]